MDELQESSSTTVNSQKFNFETYCNGWSATKRKVTSDNICSHVIKNKSLTGKTHLMN